MTTESIDIGGGATASASRVTVNYPFEFIVMQPVAQLLVQRVDRRRAADDDGVGGDAERIVRSDFRINGSNADLHRVPARHHGGRRAGVRHLQLHAAAAGAGRRRSRRARSWSPRRICRSAPSSRRDDLRVIEWPANAAPQGRVQQPPTSSSAAGWCCRSFENEPLLPMKLASKEAGAGLPPVIPHGPARRVGARQRSHRRRRLRAAWHPRRRGRHGQSRPTSAPT